MDLRVLICDDDPVARAVLQRALEAAGLQVAGVVEDGRQAIAEAGRLTPDVVLMDVVMEGLDGVEAVRRIAREHPDIDCVLMTATPESAASTAGMDAGAAAYLPKALVAVERLPATLVALRRDPGALRRRRARRLVIGLHDAWPGLLGAREWERLERSAAEGGLRGCDELLERLAASGDPRALELAAAA